MSQIRVDEILNSAGSGPSSFPQGFKGSSAAATSSPGSNVVLTKDSEDIQILSPTVDIDVTLPTTSIAAGRQFTIVNSSSFNITIKSSNGEVITVLSKGSITLTSLQATPTTPSHWKNLLVSSQKSAENKIINSNFHFWQRGTSTGGPTTGSAYLSDRWLVDSTGSTKDVSRQSFSLGQTIVPDEPTYFHRTVVASSVGVSNYCLQEHRIESVRTLAGKKATLSFWAKADASKSIAIEFQQNFGTGGSPSAVVTAIGVTQVSLTSNWQKFIVTVDIPSISGKTLGTNDNDYLDLTIWFDAGSNFDARTGSLGQQSGTFDIAQVSLNEGSEAAPWQLAAGGLRNLGGELLLCQRYYEKTYNLGTNPGTGGVSAGSIQYLLDSVANNNFNMRGLWQFKVNKRSAPTLYTFSVSTGAGGTGGNMRADGPVTASITATLIATGESSATININEGSLSTTRSIAYHAAADAEL